MLEASSAPYPLSIERRSPSELASAQEITSTKVRDHGMSRRQSGIGDLKPVSAIPPDRQIGEVEQQQTRYAGVIANREQAGGLNGSEGAWQSRRQPSVSAEPDRSPGLSSPGLERDLA